MNISVELFRLTENASSSRTHPICLYLYDNVTLTVSIIAYPKPTFYWSRTFTSQSHLIHQEKDADSGILSYLVLTKIGKEDFKTYFCTAENIIGTVEILFVVKPKGM